MHAKKVHPKVIDYLQTRYDLIPEKAKQKAKDQTVFYFLTIYPILHEQICLINQKFEEKNQKHPQHTLH